MSSNTESKADFSDLDSGHVERAALANQSVIWIPGLRGSRATDAIHLFCFPFAGGGASVFAKWSATFPKHITVCPIQYPGRENRWGESGFTSLESLVATMANDLAPFWLGRFAFLGHSFGAIIAFELARTLSRKGYPAPQRLFLSGARAPHLPPKAPIHELPDQGFLNKLCEYNGIPDEVLENTDLMRVLLPIIREDFRLIEQHRYQSAPPISVPISVFGGLKDKNVPIADLLAWSSHTSKAFRSRFFEGDHFFLFNDQPKIVSNIVEDLEASAGSSNGSSRLGGMTVGAL